MIAAFLQDDLIEELRNIFQHFRLPDPTGERVPLNVYSQDLPIPEAQEIPDTVTDEELEEGTYDAMAESIPFPYIVVRVMDGEIKSPGSDQTVDINLLIGVIARTHDNQGHRDVMNIIQKIYERFAKNSVLAARYECLYPMQWALQEEGSFPYYFGGMSLQFTTLPITREDPYI